MKRVFGYLTFVLAVGVASGQQPDVRVRLFTLYQPRSITFVAGTHARLASDRQSRDLPPGTQVVVTANGSSVVANGHIESAITFSGDYHLSGERMAARRLRVPVRISADNGLLRAIAHFPMEEYVAAVLQGETAGRMPPEALKAMAVAIRSYATHFRDRHRTENLDFCDTTHCQYLRTEVAANSHAAVLQTRGELLWEAGTPLAAYYHKDCGGRTESAETAWPDQKARALESHDDPYCTRVADPWRSEIAPAEIDRALRNAGLRLPRDWQQIAVSGRTSSGRVRSLKISIAGGEWVPVSASSFRFALGRALGWNRLKSDWYDVSRQGDLFLFTGKGVGHGVGLCQTGASEMARQGKSYREILAFYYAGSQLGVSAQDIPWRMTSGLHFDVRAVNERDVAPVQAAAASALDWAQRETGLRLDRHPVLDVYPTVSMFRDATGEPGWVAASTKDNRIRLEPPETLGTRLESVLRHEFLHLIIESHARPDTPLWFREGLVLHLSGEARRPLHRRMTPRQIDQAIAARANEREVNEAYASAAGIIADLARQFGRRRLIEWLRGGLPANVLAVTQQGTPR